MAKRDTLLFIVLMTAIAMGTVYIMRPDQIGVDTLFLAMICMLLARIVDNTSRITSF